MTKYLENTSLGPLSWLYLKVFNNHSTEVSTVYIFNVNVCPRSVQKSPIMKIQNKATKNQNVTIW